MALDRALHPVVLEIRERGMRGSGEIVRPLRACRYKVGPCAPNTAIVSQQLIFLPLRRGARLFNRGRPFLAGH